MFRTAVLGYPRIGENRELKKAIEQYWKKEISEEDLRNAASLIRRKNWAILRAEGIDVIPSNDFSLYDQILDMTALLGAVPPRFGWKGGMVGLDTYFAMARGSKDAPAMELTKWFDTNYHYLVPEIQPRQRFRISSEKPFEEFREALELGIRTRPVLIGPVTYLTLSKARGGAGPVRTSFDALLETYVTILKRFAELGARSVQLDEPAMALDLSADQLTKFKKTYRTFANRVPGLTLVLATYFAEVTPPMAWVLSLPVSEVHLDLVRAPQQLKRALRHCPKEMTLSLGVIDGRNIWKNDLKHSVSLLTEAAKKKDARKLKIATSCSLLHVPLDADDERALDRKKRPWLAFAKQKLRELKTLQGAMDHTGARIVPLSRRGPGIRLAEVRSRIAALRPADFMRKSPFRLRQKLQRERFNLPLFPTTTIGSFPQTPKVRRARADFKSRRLSASQYHAILSKETTLAVHRQEKLGLDVLVHGEFERNDMVEYFGERLDGFLFTKNGWVQSYGTRCVKPPVIYGDVRRPKPMTLEWTKMASSLTTKPMKGMLTGPVTILQWSFVRDDQPRSETAKQIALAIRDEVNDLEKGGVSIIQIDEPAIREGLPLKKKDRAAYLRWAVDCFRLSASGVEDDTQIHTHMCYSEFNEIMGAIAEMDADVISIEASRSQMELLNAFSKFRYPNEIGPGVYDIHSPRVPTAEEMVELLKKAAHRVPVGNLWVNPDCGLKTRRWEECMPALVAMVAAAKAVRKALE